MRVLVVDDSRAMRSILGRMMGELGFDVSEAANGADALRMLQTCAPHDLVLLDWNMPEMNGYETLVALRREPNCASLPVVMVTTETELGQMQRALTAGANEYVMKPFTRDVIVGKLALLGLRTAA